MGKGNAPGEFEQVVLWILASFEDEATGRQIYETLTQGTGRDVSVAAVHITLARLEEKGWAECRTSAPEAGRGGKPRRRYTLSKEGAALLVRLRRQSDQLWATARNNPLLRQEVES